MVFLEFQRFQVLVSGGALGTTGIPETLKLETLKLGFLPVRIFAPDQPLLTLT
jgi:hypothetical protein